jgi:hypothetical protein
MKHKYRIISRNTYFPSGRTTTLYYAQFRRFLFFWRYCADIDMSEWHNCSLSYNDDYDSVERWVNEQIEYEIRNIERRNAEKCYIKQKVIKTF